MKKLLCLLALLPLGMVAQTAADLKAAALEILNDRIVKSQAKGFNELANQLQVEYNALNAQTPALPQIPEKGLGLYPVPSITTGNPYITSIHNWAANYLRTTMPGYPKSVQGTTIFPKESAGGLRTVGADLERLYWLLLSPLSNYRYSKELFKRFLNTIYATTDDYLLNGGNHLSTPGSTENGLDDWFALSMITYGWHRCDASFADYLAPSLRTVMQGAASRAGGIYYDEIKKVLPLFLYVNRDISYAEIVLHCGLYRQQQEWVDACTLVVDSISTHALFPDGATAYRKKQNECTNYHGGTINSLAKIYSLIGYKPARDCVIRSKNYDVISTENGNVPEFYTAPTWKTQWNAATGYSNFPALGMSGCPFLKSRLDQTEQIFGKNPDPNSISYYRTDIVAKPIPDNYIVYDRNIQGARGRYGDYSYGFTTRPTAQNANDMGLQTFVGSMLTEEYPGKGAQRRMHAALMCVHPKVHTEGGWNEEWSQWAYTAENVRSEVSVARQCAAMSSSFSLQRQTAGPTGYSRPWGGFQQWITLPDRMIGMIEVFPTTTAKAYEVDVRVRFTVGRTNPFVWKDIVVEEAGKAYSYGRYKCLIHTHDFDTVKTGKGGAHRDDYLENGREVILRHNPTNNKIQATYTTDFRRFAVVEIQNGKVSTPTEVKRITECPNLSGLMATINETTYSVWKNHSEIAQLVDLKKYLPKGVTSELHFSRNDTPGRLPQRIRSTLFTIPAGSQLLVISSTDKSLWGNAWRDYDELLQFEGEFSKRDTPPKGDAPKCWTTKP